ncbi:MAG: D-sedoheptulose 7-phosphate isomerase [Acidaminococcales bacterium]|nr:D-sedoheptulose 7-phosphate isomerase [Acidaminococcales bacterium]
MRVDIEKQIAEHQKVMTLLKKTLAGEIEAAARIAAGALKKGNKLLFCGNGGSAADCQHLAAEFVGRFRKERKGLPAVALTTDTSILTAVGNDYGFERIFSRQVEALGVEGDVLFAFSTSGDSPNVLLAAEAARKKGLRVVALTGGNGGKLKAAGEICLNVPASATARVQEGHMLIGHIICALLDDY